MHAITQQHLIKGQYQLTNISVKLCFYTLSSILPVIPQFSAHSLITVVYDPQPQFAFCVVVSFFLIFN